MHERHTDRELYFREQAHTTRKHVIPFIETVMPVTPALSVLEIGCGEGGNLLPFLEVGCSRVTGIDLSEYKIENVVSTFWMSDGKGLELRLMGDFGAGQLQMMTHDGSAEHNSGTANGAIAINTWYHCAVVYNHSTGQASFYLDKALIGSANANWSNYTMKWLCIGAWPNPAGSCRDIAGYIDAFAVSDTALDPDDFELYKVTAVDDWTLF